MIWRQWRDSSRASILAGCSTRRSSSRAATCAGRFALCITRRWRKSMAFTRSDPAAVGTALKIESPDSALGIAEILRDASAANSVIAVSGGGSKAALGNTGALPDVALSTIRLNRVLHYEPTDLTLSVEAGARF